MEMISNSAPPVGADDLDRAGELLRVLKAAGVVAGRRSGREVRYQLVDSHLAEIVVAAVAHAAEDRS